MHQEIQQWLLMDGFAAYIWPSYILALILLLGLLILSRRKLTDLQRRQDALTGQRQRPITPE